MRDGVQPVPTRRPAFVAAGLSPSRKQLGPVLAQLFVDTAATPEYSVHEPTRNPIRT